MSEAMGSDIKTDIMRAGSGKAKTQKVIMTGCEELSPMERFPMHAFFSSIGLFGLIAQLMITYHLCLLISIVTLLFFVSLLQYTVYIILLSQLIIHRCPSGLGRPSMSILMMLMHVNTHQRLFLRPSYTRITIGTLS